MRVGERARKGGGRELGTEEGKRARRWKSNEDARRRGRREEGGANGWGCDEEGVPNEFWTQIV